MSHSSQETKVGLLVEHQQEVGHIFSNCTEWEGMTVTIPQPLQAEDSGWRLSSFCCLAHLLSLFHGEE